MTGLRKTVVAGLDPMVCWVLGLIDRARPTRKVTRMVKFNETTAVLNAKLARDCVRQAIRDAVLAGMRRPLINDMRAIAKRLDGAYRHAELMAQRQRRKDEH